MKSIFVLTMSLLASTAFAKEVPAFAAFSQGDDLHVSFIGDSCNNFQGALKVDSFCHADRNTRNLAPVCEAEMIVISTRMGCNDKKPVARVVTVSLNANKVAAEAKLLKLSYEGQTINVKLNQQ